MLNKKAITMSIGAIVAIIILVVSLLSILAAVFLVRPEFSKASVVRICHESIVWRTTTSYKTLNTDVNWLPISCKTQDIEIQGNREELKDQLSQLMATCWFMFNEARQDDVLSGAEIAKVFGWEDNNNLCFLCYTVSIDQKSIDGGPIEELELARHLAEKEHHILKGVKYLDYFQSYGGPGRVALLEPINPQKSYGILFLSRSKDDAKWTIADSIISSVLNVGGVNLGSIYSTVKHANIALSKINFYKEERDTSVIALDDLKGAQASKCLIEDIAT
jgi:hypothetical protein